MSFESATAELIQTSHTQSGRGTLYTLAGFFVVLILFTCLVQIDRLVMTPGRLYPVAGAFTVQPLEKQIIRRVLVAVGDKVKKGQVLATCDPTFAQASLVTLQQQVNDLDAQLRRIQAEIAGKPFVATPGNPYDAVQATLWQRRQTEFKSGLADFDSRLAGANAQITELHQDVAHDKEQLKIAEKVETMNAELQKPGYVSQLDLLASQTTRITASRGLVDAENSLEAAMHMRESTLALRKVFIDKWHEDALKELVGVQTTLDQARQDLIKAQRTSELVDLRAPEDAMVIQIPKLTTGGIATDAQALFGLVPIGTPLEAELQIDSKDVGFVQVGDKVTIKLDAYEFLEHGYLEGRVKSIGTDTLTEESNEDTGTGTATGSGQTRTPYYDARVTITALKLHDVPAEFQLIPGMTLQADIVVGHRTIIWYLIGAALRSGSEAMHEP